MSVAALLTAAALFGCGLVVGAKLGAANERITYLLAATRRDDHAAASPPGDHQP